LIAFFIYRFEKVLVFSSLILSLKLIDVYQSLSYVLIINKSFKHVTIEFINHDLLIKLFSPSTNLNKFFYFLHTPLDYHSILIRYSNEFVQIYFVIEINGDFDLFT